MDIDINNLTIKDLSKPLVNGNSVFSLLISDGKEADVINIVKNLPESALVADLKGDTVLHILGYFNRLKAFHKIAKINPKALNSQNNDGDTPLFYILHDSDLVKNIIDNLDPDLKIMNNSNDTLLSHCIKKYKDIDDEYYRSAIHLIKSKKIDLNEPKKYPPIILAVVKENIELLKLIHENGGDMDALSSDYASSLNIAISTNKKKVLDYVIKYTKNVENNGPEGDNNPLIASIVDGNFDIVEQIIDKGYDVNKTNRFLETMCHIILDSNAPKDTIYKILNKGDLNIQNIDGVTPLHLLLSKHNWRDFSTLLRSKKLDIFVKNSEGKTPFSFIKNEDISDFIKVVVESYIDQSPSKKFREKCKNLKCYDAVFRSIVNTKRSYPTPSDHFRIEDFRFIKKDTGKNYGAFNSDSLHNILYTLHFLQNNKNVFPVFKYKIDAKVKTEEIESVNLYRNECRTVYYLVNMYRDLLYEMSSYLVVWRDKNCYFMDPDLDIYVVKLMKSKKIRFIFLKLTLVVGRSSTHANIIIYDKKTNTAERFDPYGKIPYLDPDSMDLMIENRLKTVFGDKLKYLAPKDYMDISFQIISNDSDIDVKKLGDPTGYCLAWTFWYLEMRINNPDIHPKALVKMSIERINSEIKSDGGYKFIDFIRQYAHTLDEGKNRILKQIGIKREDLYNMTFKSDDEKIILDGCANIFNKLCSEI